MTSRQIRLFLSVAESLNFTKASQENHVSQPTTSRQIAQLEEELNISLFYRDQNVIRLTAAGSVIAAELRQMQERFEQVLESVKDAKKQITGTLSIGYLGYLNADLFIYPAVAKFTKHHPNVEVRAEPATLPVLRDGLERGEFDVIFVYSLDMHMLKRVVSKKFAKVSQMLAVSSQHPLTLEAEIDLAKWFSGETFLLPSAPQSRVGARRIKELCIRHQIQDVRFRDTKSMDDMFLHVRAGEGVALVTSDNPCYYDSRYHCIPLPEEERPEYVMAVWTRENKSDILPLFVEWLEEGGEQT